MEKRFARGNPVKIMHIVPYRKKIIKSLFIEPAFITKITLIAATAISHVCAFIFLYNTYGKGLAALSILPVSVCGWFYGVRGGVFAAVLALPVNLSVINLFSSYALRTYIMEGGALAGMIALLFVGAVVGRVSELSVRVRRELKERKEAETELRKTKEFLENIIESSLDCIAVTDDKGYITRVNRAFLDMVGYTYEEVLGKGMYYFFLRGPGTYESTTGQKVTLDEAFFVEAAKTIDTLMTRGIISSWQSYYISKDALIIPVEQTAVLLKDKSGTQIGSVGIIRDITERKKAEEELSATSQKLSSLISSSPLAIVVLDPQLAVTLWNPAAEKIFGWCEQDVVGSAVPFARSSGGECSRFLKDVVRTMQGKETELRVPRKDGTIIDAAVSAAPLRDESGHVTAVMMILSDVSENKRLQRGILDVSGREQTRIGLDLHDGLGQVLSGVSFMGKALERKLADKGLEEVEDASEITRLINEAISQTRSVARSLYPVTLESDGLMAALEELAAHTENLFNISCDFTYNEQLLVDDNTVALHLYRIAQEAVNNAIRHGKARHIVISLQAGIKNVLKISDDGTGFNTAEAERTGMGIDLMNYRANMIGSSIAIESTPGSGTSITCAFGSDR